ncbi:reprolysin-like metallopeptidase [Roseivirga sp. BDSF3-8]|uniref:reprolysin-like metallopeptidase n=1 Tax=Roseivirga sp. BDSF3-8 TaxID=3241598 RepID=UPI00353180E6
MKKILLLSLLFCTSAFFLPTAFSQSTGNSLWSPSSQTYQRAHTTEASLRHMSLNVDAFKSLLLTKASTLTVPSPNGGYMSFIIKENSVMARDLAKRYPNLKAFSGYDTSDPRNRIRLDFDGYQTHIAVSTPEGAFMVDPKGLGNQYIIYNEGRDPQTATREGGCTSLAGSQPIKKDMAAADAYLSWESQAVQSSGGAYLKEFRLALAATGEYTQLRGSKEDALAAMVTTVNRANLVLERDLGIRFVLSSETDRLIYTDPATDPFPDTPSDESEWLSQAQQAIDDSLGSSAYDLGHVLTLGGGGAAFTGTVCREGEKAMGRSGQRYAPGHSADIYTFLHETGHQLGGTHTFNGDEMECNTSHFAPTAWEPGSGTTLMSYAYFCGSQRLETDGSLLVNYFHGGTIEQINQVTEAACPRMVPVDNSAPQANLPAEMEGRILPKGTPFVLRGSHYDPDGDRVTYTWEQMDTGPQGAPDNVEGSAPLFRSLPPSGEAHREFPRMEGLLSGTPGAGEMLPGYGRDLSFRLTVRDGAGAQGWADLTMSISDTIGPLAFTYPARGTVLAPGSEATLTWLVNDTDKAPVNLTELNLLFSADDGNTWDILTFFTPNDGEQGIMVPDVSTRSARLKLESTDGVVYTLSERFAIESTGPDPCETIAATTGKVYVEEWHNRSGSTIPSTLPFEGDTYVSLPDTFGSLDLMEAPRNSGDYYLRRMRAAFCAPQPGDYTFYIYGDDQCRLYIYPQDDPAERQQLAAVDTYAFFREWNRHASQQSAPVSLEQGTVYVLEAVHKDNKGQDHVGVGWRLPDGQSELPIPASRLSPVIPNPATATPALRQVCENNQTTWYLDNPGSEVLVRWQADEAEQTLMAGPGSTNLPETDAYQVTVSWLNEAGLKQTAQQARGCASETTEQPAILAEIWENVSGTTVDKIPVNTAASRMIELSELKSDDLGSTYGERIRVLFHPSTSGIYRFMIAGDDESVLYLSADDQAAGRQEVARVSTWSLAGEFTRYPEQISQEVYLTQGASYYLEVLHKENYGGGHVQVGMENMDTGEKYASIPSSMLSGYNSGQSKLMATAPAGQEAEAFHTAGQVSLDAYPNPSEGIITIRTVSGNMPDGWVTVMDASGREVTELAYTGSPVQIDLSDRRPGLYLLRLRAGDQTWTERILIR